MNVPYKIVIEPQEYDEYSKVIDPSKILVLPFSNLGQGSIPARNWVWEHSIEQGAEKHWILDDNLEWFYRYNNNNKIKCDSGTVLKIAEDFTDRYTNVAISGLNYEKFCPKTDNRPAFRINTRVYSCLLIRNDIPFRWRGKYNEDTDLCIRVLKDDWCTIIFNAFLCGKRTTLVQKGGNAEIYEDDGRLKMAQSLEEQHPDIVRVIRRFNRWQHYVDYSGFTQTLKRKEGLNLVNKINNYGLKIVDISKKDENSL
jgi:hypothetical protein